MKCLKKTKQNKTKINNLGFVFFLFFFLKKPKDRINEKPRLFFFVSPTRDGTRCRNKTAHGRSCSSGRVHRVPEVGVQRSPCNGARPQRAKGYSSSATRDGRRPDFVEGHPRRFCSAKRFVLRGDGGVAYKQSGDVRHLLVGPRGHSSRTDALQTRLSRNVFAAMVFAQLDRDRIVSDVPQRAAIRETPRDRRAWRSVRRPEALDPRLRFE
jgi:hypothetical protein